MSEFAPGLPSKASSHELPKISKPTVWEYAIHDHHAERRGRHFDLRLGDPATGHAHSWALPPQLPKPGEHAWAIQQPTHTVKYMDFEGTLPAGYGAGEVSLHKRDKTEVLRAQPGHVAFNVYRSSGPDEFVLHRVHGDKWKLFNVTPKRADHELPDSKPPYKEISPHSADKYFDDDDYIASAKIDDAHNLFWFPGAGKQVRVMSYRPSKKNETGIIDHTFKVPVFRDGLKTPEGLGGTILRGGLYAIHPETGEATPAAELAGMLNSNVWKSREKQLESGELIPVLYDVVQYKGRNIAGAPYKVKLHVLKKVIAEMGHAFHLPRIAYGKEAKRKLVKDMQHGLLPETKEGVVFWNMNKSGPPVKAKFRAEHDVYIKGFFPAEGKYKGKAVGGFLFSHTPDGPIVGKVGTGFSDEVRREMYLHPDQYRGMVARVTAHEQFESGALRSPSFEGWHLDKNDPVDLVKVKHASGEPSLIFFWGKAIA